MIWALDSLTKSYLLCTVFSVLYCLVHREPMTCLVQLYVFQSKMDDRDVSRE